MLILISVIILLLLLKYFFKDISRCKKKIFFIIKIGILWCFIYFILWSIVNYWFYINLYFLTHYLHYDFIYSVKISMNLTTDLSTVWFYTKLLLYKIFNVYSFENLITELDNQIQELINIYGDFSETEAGLDTFWKFLKFIF